MVQLLNLQTAGADQRTHPIALKKDMHDAGSTGALLLPTASIDRVEKTNRECVQIAAQYSWLSTAGTLHPEYPGNVKELSFFKENAVKAIKMCSFSQAFSLEAPSTLEMFRMIESAGEESKTPFAVLLDTFQKASHYFGTDPAFNTTPQLLSSLSDRFPGINFIGAHMGGLCASGDMLCRYLQPRENLYLDTSNASHTLSKEEFCRLLELHGPKRIIFGTDWPWFIHAAEVERISGLLDAVGFSENEKQDVFSNNILRLLGGESA